MTLDSESNFISKIDCKFPYNDREACLSLINEAAALSTNSMFMVIHEICRVPSSAKDKVNTDFLIGLLEETKTKFNHPLKDMVLDTAINVVNGHDLTVDEAMLRMVRVKYYKGQYNALSIMYFSCDDKEDRLEPLWDKIISEWNNNAT